jgi:hypothetical protein
MAGRKLKGAPETEETWVDRVTIAKYFGCNLATVNKWRDLGMPYDDEKGYPVSQCFSWRIKKAEQDAIAKATPEDMKEAKLAKAWADAKKAEYELATMMGELITVQDAAAGYVKHVGAIRNVVKANEGKHTLKIHGKKTLPETQEAISTMFDEMISEIDTVLEGITNDTTSKILDKSK